MRRSNAQGKESNRSCSLARKGSVVKYAGDDRGLKGNGEVYKVK